MKFKHLFAIVASFFLSACNGGTTPSPSNNNDDVSRLNNIGIELDNNNSFVNENSNPNASFTILTKLSSKITAANKREGYATKM